MENIKLPALRDLYNDVVITEKENQLNVLLNHEPKDGWLLEHPVAKKVKYLSIQRIEFLLTSIFQVWTIDIKEIKLIANSVVAVIRLNYKDPITGNMLYQDGVGAAPLQTDKDAGAIDFNKIKSNAVMLAAPAAESFAVKDAAHKIGKLFGKDLNRADAVMYDKIADKFTEDNKLLSKEKSEEIQELISNLSCGEDEKIGLEMELTTLTTKTVDAFMLKIRQ